MNLEERITNAVMEKLTDGTVEELVKKNVESAINKSLEDMFSRGGAGKKMIDEKVKEVIVPVIERHNFNQYMVKLDSILSWEMNTFCDINSLRNLSQFDIFLMTLKRGFVDIEIDTESEYEDDIEPEAKPEWNLD